MRQQEGPTRSSLLLSEAPRLLTLQLCDGTNVPADTDFVYAYKVLGGNHVELHDDPSNSRWRERADNILKLLRELRSISRPLVVGLTQRRTPSHGENGRPSSWRDHHMLAMGSGIHVEPSYLLDRHSQQPMRGEFAFLDANGSPIRFSSGHPVGLKLGWSRSYTLIEGPQHVHDSRQLELGRLQELLTEAGNFLASLPASAFENNRTRTGKSLVLAESPFYAWVDAMFEFAWTSRPGHRPLTRAVYDETGHTSLTLHGDGLFPRIPIVGFPVAKDGDLSLEHRFPSEAGYPFLWHSEIKDIVAEPIEFLEWVLAEEPTTNRAQSKLKVFISYSHEDEAYVKALKNVLRPLERSDAIEYWYDRKLIPAQNIKRTIPKKLGEADICICLLSSDYLGSDFCVEKELKLAMERASEGQLALCGIVIRPCSWRQTFPETPLLLPTDAKSVTSWDNSDEAWHSVAVGIQNLVGYLHANKKPWHEMDYR